MKGLFLRAIGYVLTCVSVADAAVSGGGQTIFVNGISYYASPDPVSIISATADMLNSAKTSGVDLIPVTVMEDSSSLFTTDVFRTIVNNYTASDDVFNSGFLQAIYLKHTGAHTAAVKYPLGAALTQYGTKLFMPSRAYTSSVQSQGHTFTGWRTEIPAGPYFISSSSGEVYKAYRLYSDVQGAFTEGVKQDTDGAFSILSAAIPGAQSLTIGVPSRLYYTKTATQPLAGVRLGVKDIYDIAGIKTSCGNRAYYNLYPARTATAEAVQRLIDAGAVIIGKMKTSQFANGEQATADWVDYHSPFNIRGDGYQDPSSSSSGPGAGIGSYDWLDIGLGSDTGGSIRGPSDSNGCFGNRPSWGLVSLDGVMPLSPAMDTAGFLTRDPFLWHEAAKVLYGNNITSNFKSFPKKIITSGFPTAATSESDSIILDFLAKLQGFIGGTNTTTLSYNNLWQANPPAAAGNSSISQFLGKVYPTLIGQQQYKEFTLPFYADYAAANEGRRPFIDPVPLTRWAWAEALGPDAEAQALSNKTVFTEWWNSTVMLPSEESCSESLLLYVGADGGTNYRNQYFGSPSAPSGFSDGRLSPFTGFPDFVFPIGQAAYNSSITLKEEYLPVTIDVVASKGCDGMIFALAEALTTAGILKVPKTGSLMY